MDQFEDTVVNPNIALNNFEVKIREPSKNKTAPKAAYAPKEMKASDQKNSKAIYLLALLIAIFIYQISTSL